MMPVAFVHLPSPRRPIRPPVPRPRTNPLTRVLGLAAAWLVLLVVGLGVSQHAVVCNQPCCQGHVKLAPSCDHAGAKAAANAPCACCRHEGHGRAEQPGEGDRAIAGRGCSGCVHVSLGVDLGLPPLTAAPPSVAPAPLAAVVLERTWRETTSLAVVHPPATGPPRPDRRTALRASTVLRL